MNDKLMLSGKSEFKGRNGYAKLSHVTGFMSSDCFYVELYSKRACNAAPAKLLLTDEDRVALTGWLAGFTARHDDAVDDAAIEAYRQAAKLEYNDEGTIEIDDTAVVSRSEGGAYVAAWVWVPDEDDSQPMCSVCSKPIGPDESSIEQQGGEVHARCAEDAEDATGEVVHQPEEASA